MSKVTELREQLGLQTRRHNETLAETASLRELLRVERDRHSALRAAHATQTATLEQTQQSEAELRAQLAELQVRASRGRLVLCLLRETACVWTTSSRGFACGEGGWHVGGSTAHCPRRIAHPVVAPAFV